MKIKVGMEFLNHDGVAMEILYVASFRSMAWAETFIKDLEADLKNDKYCRVVVEEEIEEGELK